MKLEPTEADRKAAEAQTRDGDGHWYGADVRAAYLAGVLAERERCAKAAETDATDYFGDEGVRAAKAIAEVIRRGP